MPGGFDHVNTNTHDIDAAISIGLDTAGNHTTADPGVAIGQRVLGSTDPSTKLPLQKSVLIGSDIFTDASSGQSIEGSVSMGRDIGLVTGVSNVLMGGGWGRDLNEWVEGGVGGGVGRSCVD